MFGQFLGVLIVSAKAHVEAEEFEDVFRIVHASRQALFTVESLTKQADSLGAMMVISRGYPENDHDPRSSMILFGWSPSFVLIEPTLELKSGYVFAVRGGYKIVQSAVHKRDGMIAAIQVTLVLSECEIVVLVSIDQDKERGENILRKLKDKNSMVFGNMAEVSISDSLKERILSMRSAKEYEIVDIKERGAKKILQDALLKSATCNQKQREIAVSPGTMRIREIKAFLNGFNWTIIAPSIIFVGLLVILWMLFQVERERAEIRRSSRLIVSQ